MPAYEEQNTENPQTPETEAAVEVEAAANEPAEARELDEGNASQENLEPEENLAEDEDYVEDDEDESDDYEESDEDDEDLEDDEDSAAEEDEPQVTFHDLGLPKFLLKAVDDLGFVHPTAIQAAAIPELLKGHDVVGLAQTGTGKTAAFGLPLLAQIDPDLDAVQALVLAPTRELAVQSADAITDFARRSRDVEVVAVYGGSSYVPQLRALERGAQVVVGTPGRIMDLIDRGALDLSHVTDFVLDEADEMLRMGFEEDVETIASSIPEGHRTALFSATMPRGIERVAREHLKDPVRIEVDRPASTVGAITQTYAVVPFRHKNGALARVLATTDADAALIFVRTKSTAEEVSLDLSARGIHAAALSGDVAQRDRERIVERLRGGTLDVIVATDVAARGLDVERIGLVVNYDVPREPDTYVHRIGRTGRAGRTGQALTFFTPRERSQLHRIERTTGAKLEEVPIPTPLEVSAHRSKQIIAEAQERQERGRLRVYLDALRDTLGEDPEVNDVLALTASMLAVGVGDEGPAPRRERDEERRPRVRREEHVDEDGEFLAARFDGGYQPKERGFKERGQGGGRRPYSGSGLTTKYRVDVGHRDGVQPGAIVGALTGESNLRGADIGRIQIFPSFSLVDIDAPVDEETRRRLGKAMVGGRALRLRVDEGPGAGKRDTREFGDRPRTGFKPKGKFAYREDSDRGGYEGRGGYRGRGKRDFGSDREDRGGYRGRRDFGEDRTGSEGRGGYQGRGNREFGGKRDFGGNRGGYQGRGGYRGRNRD